MKTNSVRHLNYFLIVPVSLQNKQNKTENYCPKFHQISVCNTEILSAISSAMENPKQYNPSIDPWNTINPWTTNPTTTLRGPHCPAEYQRPVRIQKSAPKASKALSGLDALDIIEPLYPNLHAGILEHARTEPPSGPLLISPWNISPTALPWEPLRVRGDYPQVLALLAKYQNGCANPSLKQIARAEKAFAHMLFGELLWRSSLAYTSCFLWRSLSSSLEVSMVMKS
jgi:hypothetical protein